MPSPKTPRHRLLRTATAALSLAALTALAACDEPDVTGTWVCDMEAMRGALSRTMQATPPEQRQKQEPIAIQIMSIMEESWWVIREDGRYECCQGKFDQRSRSQGRWEYSKPENGDGLLVLTQTHQDGEKKEKTDQWRHTEGRLEMVTTGFPIYILKRKGAAKE